MGTFIAIAIVGSGAVVLITGYLLVKEYRRESREGFGSPAVQALTYRTESGREIEINPESVLRKPMQDLAAAIKTGTPEEIRARLQESRDLVKMVDTALGIK